MANYGYVKGFTIEHDPTVKKRIDCKDCNYYDKRDKSCMKRPLYLPEDGYNSWRKCKYFDFNNKTSHSKEKQEQLNRIHKKPSEGWQQLELKLVSSAKKTTSKQILSRFGKYIMYVPIQSVVVSKKLSVATPKENKIQEVIDYYNENKELDKPILVANNKDNYVLTDGYTRFMAAKALRLDRVPVIINNRMGSKRVALCKKGKRVNHVAFGEGKVISFSLKYIDILFDGRTEPHTFDLDFCADYDMLGV